MQLFLWLIFDKAACYFQYLMEHQIQLGHLHHHLTLHRSFWSIIGLINICISQFINLLYMYTVRGLGVRGYIQKNNRYYGIYGILNSGHIRDTKDYQILPKHHNVSWAVLGLMQELWHCCVYLILARIKMHFPDDPAMQHLFPYDCSCSEQKTPPRAFKSG